MHAPSRRHLPAKTPHDAAACFLATGIDYLVLHDMLIAKGPWHKVVAPLVNIYADIAVMVRAGVGGSSAG